ncbi:MAG: gamma-glutamyltransferase [Bdellovibrionia bacterium]
MHRRLPPTYASLSLLVSLSLLLGTFPRISHAADPLYGESIRMPVGGTQNQGMIAADDREAASWGAEVLRKGGNAVDAAIATAFAMSVTRPHFASIGGGGFMIFCPASKECKALDFREKAPGAAKRDMYLRNGKADTNLSRNGALASGVPGNVAGWLQALERFGSKSRASLLIRPIQMAERGVRVSTHTERAALERWGIMNAEARRIFGCGHLDHPCEVGSLLKQQDLAKTLREISKKGTQGFYTGWVAEKIASGVQNAGGILQIADLKDYQSETRAPLKGQFHGFEIVTMPPPSSGGVALLQMLAFMDRARDHRLLQNGPGAAQSLNAEAYAMSLAFADRAEHLGDPAFYPVPLAQLLDSHYLDERWKSFNPDHAHIAAGAGQTVTEPSHTTHLSVIDSMGNAVAMTITVNDNFGSGFVPPGTGVVMNNQMDDFSAQPGVPNLFGLVGAEANSVQPGKRPLSSMTPTIVRDSKGEVRIAIGAAGGPKIITAVFQSLLNRLEYGMPLTDAVAAPRIHHQWKPETVLFEKLSFPFEVRESLKKSGYKTEESPRLGVVHAVERLPDHRIVGVPDPRGEGAAVGQ